MSKRQKKRLGKEHLQRIIDLCRSVEGRGVDPFLVDVDNIIEFIHEYFPEWKNASELCLDAEAVKQVASAVKSQSEWVKHRSTSLYTDPFLIEEKLLKLPKEEIYAILLECWHPIVELEQISPTGLKEATKYWESLTPLKDRWQNIENSPVDAGTTTFDELRKQQIIAEKEFSKMLETFWQELRRKTKGLIKIEYWDFIGAETYEETARRAYFTSFLVTYGYATLEVDRLEEIVYIIPFETPISSIGKKHATSLPIPVNVEDWKHWRKGEKS